jgi:3-hydroxybutyryl-CoA dehydrogenase
MSIQNIAVIGAGTMGNGIAHVFAQSGFNVTLVDVAQAQLDRALSTIDANLGRQVKKGTLTEDDQKATIGRIKTDTSVAISRQRSLLNSMRTHVRA